MQTIVVILVAFVREIVLSRAALQLENIALRHQVTVLKRERSRPWLGPLDRVFWLFLSRLWPLWKDTLVIVKPNTVIGWHRQGFRLFWKWKSCHGKPGRPRTSKEIRELIRRMSRENPLWGTPRIHGELLKLGIDVSQATVSRHMMRHSKPPSQTWRTFLDNHVGCLASIDFFVVPTATFTLLSVFIVLRHERRRIEHFGVTAHPSGNWVAQQICETFPYVMAPRPPLEPFKVLPMPLGARDATQNSFGANAKGHAKFAVTFSPCLQLSGRQVDTFLAIVWHSDGKTYGANPGPFSKMAHIQFFTEPFPIEDR